MPVEIEVTYRVVTPLFCAGADPARPELRLPSFKGVLRFWWRALAWSRHSANPDAIRTQEDALFGSAGGGQSRVSMRLDLPAVPRTVHKDEVLTVSRKGGGVVGEGARYLGYGVMEAFARTSKGTKSGQLTRACFRTPFDFTVLMRCRDLNEAELTSLKDALSALGTLGGMGAKSRKGYGSLVIRALRVNGVEEWSRPRSLDALRDAIKALRRDDGPESLPAFTALSGKTRHVLLSSDKKEPVELLNLVGRELVRYRSWGRNGQILGGSAESERRFKDDHDLMKSTPRMAHRSRGPRASAISSHDPMEPASRKPHPRRIAFGLPHNYGKRDEKQVGPFDKELDRRASPLFIHIHECAGMPVAVLSFLPARFLPEGKSKGKSYISVGGSKVLQQPEDELYRPIHEFLDRLRSPSQRKEKFVDALEVHP